jgi:putative transposase
VFSRRIVGWAAGMSKETGLVLDAIEQGLRDRDYRWREGQDKLIHYSDAGSRYTSLSGLTVPLGEGILRFLLGIP